MTQAEKIKLTVVTTLAVQAAIHCEIVSGTTNEQIRKGIAALTSDAMLDEMRKAHTCIDEST